MVCRETKKKEKKKKFCVRTSVYSVHQYVRSCEKKKKEKLALLLRLALFLIGRRLFTKGYTQVYPKRVPSGPIFLLLACVGLFVSTFAHNKGAPPRFFDSRGPRSWRHPATQAFTTPLAIFHHLAGPPDVLAPLALPVCL